MFDWDDQELANIIWGEDKEANDHLVPFPEDLEKKVLDYVDNGKKTLIEDDSKSESDKKKSTSKLFLEESKIDKNDSLSDLGALINSELDMPSFSGSITHDVCIAKKSQLAIGPKTSPNHHEDKELGDLVGNSWSSIGSFDDLDRIFSNDELEGNTSLGSTDELWSSSKDLLSGVAKSSSAALGSTNWEFGALGCTAANEIDSEFLHNEKPSLITGSQKQDKPSPYPHQTIGKHVEKEVNTMGATDLAGKEEKWFKARTKKEKAIEKQTDSSSLRSIYDTWPSSALNVPQFGRQCAPATLQSYPMSPSDQQDLSQNYRTMPCQHFAPRYDAPYAYRNFNQHAVMGTLNPTDDEHQSILSSSEVSPGDVISLNKHAETRSKPAKMTPQEKIEKLRRRQQMRAMLAIQKQQQRLGHQVSSGDYPLSGCSFEQNQNFRMEKSDVEPDEILNTLPCYDPCSPNKGCDPSRISSIDSYSVEDTVLYQLQDIISRLDMNIRLCIRDSLYRLAHSATQRHYASNTSSVKRSTTYEHENAREETTSCDRFVPNINVETETNQIDRAVAHLLFHRPLNFSVRHIETPESSTSTKVSTEQEIVAPCTLPVGLLGKDSENEHNPCPHEPKSPRTFVDSHEDVSNDVSQNEIRANPHMKQTMAEHAD